MAIYDNFYHSILLPQTLTFVCLLCSLAQREEYPPIFHPHYAPLENIPRDYFSGHNWTFITISTTLLQYVLICKSMIITVGMKENFGSIVE